MLTLESATVNDTVNDLALAVIELREQYRAGKDANEVDQLASALLRQAEDMDQLSPYEQVAVNRIMLDLHGLLNSVYSGA